MEVDIMKLEIYEPLYEMANISRNTTGENFELWIDDSGKDRNVGHNLPRFKPKTNGIELDIVIDGDKIYIDNPNPRKIKKFKYSKEALEFVERFKKPLLMHWNRKIDTAQLGTIFTLVIKKKYTIEDAIKFVTED